MTSFINDAPGGRRGGSGLTLLVLDRAAIMALNLPGGTTWNWSRGLGVEIRREAKDLLIAGGHVDSGALLRSTDYSIVPVGMGVQINVRASSRHALWFILGTLPHEEQVQRTIVYANDPPKGSRAFNAGFRAGDEDVGYMKFFWIKGGFTRYEHRVWHPGWHGYNYLDEAKLDVLIQRGII